MATKLKTIEEVELFISKANSLLGYPDNTGTLTYCNVPEIDVNGDYEIPITSELNEKLIEIGIKQMLC